MQRAPRETGLYRRIAKDYSPKQAAMQICKYVEQLESRICDLEAKTAMIEEGAVPTLDAATGGTTAKKTRASSGRSSTSTPESAARDNCSSTGDFIPTTT